jgi:predicted chitinase
MTSNGKPHFSKNIFQNQSNGVLTEKLDASVVQDKARMKSARIASAQPAAHKKVARAREMGNSPTRSQNRANLKQKTVQLTLWVDPIIKAEVTRLAEREGLSVSATGRAFLEKAIQTDLDLQYGALLTPIIETAIDKRMRSRDTRLAWLLVRVAFDTGQIRSLVTNILGKQQGMTEDILKNILAMSQKTAKGNITRKTPQIAELMEAVEKWLNAEEKEQAN